MAQKTRKNTRRNRRLNDVQQKRQINPKHYQKRMRFSTTFDPQLDVVAQEKDTPVQVVDVIETFVANNSHLAHALTYLLRAGEKVESGESPEQALVRDYKKAAWWIARLIEYRTGEPNPYAE